MHEHPNLLGVSVPPPGVTVLLSPSLPSSGWLLIRLHPNRRLTGVLLLRPSQLPGFALVSATLIGWYKPLLRPLTQRSMGLGTDALVLVPMVLDRMPDAKESDAELQVQCHTKLV
jgi:hypothetical protein